MNMIRQGDVLLIQVTEIPTGAKDETPEGRIVLAVGEVTGHAHAIVQDRAAPKARLWSAAGERFIQALELGAVLTHEEHAPVVMPPGTIWKQIFQMEERGTESHHVTD